MIGSMKNLVLQPAGQLAKSIREKQVTSVEVLEAHLQQIGKHNPRLRAIATLNEEGARRRATEADEAIARGNIWGPLHGVPVTVKDSFETAGLRTTSSYLPLARYVPDQDATVVARLRGAGAIILGKTNMPALCGDYQSNSRLFGRANNPWNLARTPGGSTGGGAAAVAAGLSPLEIGSDIGGSVRVPAHFCGIFGFKPTEHRVSGAGHIPPLPGAEKSARKLISFGPLARSVADLRLSLQVIAGPDDRDPTVSAMPLDTPSGRPLRQRRFAWMDDFAGVPVTADTRAALEKLAGELAALGCRVERVAPRDFDFRSAWRTCNEIAAAERHSSTFAVGRLLMIMGTVFMPFKSPMTDGYSRGLRLGKSGYARAIERRAALTRSLEEFLADWDAWICPVASVPAFKHRTALARARPFSVDGRRLSYEMTASAHTALFNFTGSPAAVLPLTLSQDGLPIGVQLVGRHWQDMELLDVAEQVAEVAGQFWSPPGY